MTEATLTSIESGSRRALFFFYALLALTWLPLISLPVLSLAHVPFDSSLLLGLAVFAGGVGHVASTGSVYVDREVREVMRPRPARFYLLPAATLMITAGAIVWGSTVAIADSLTAGLFLIHLLWLHYHYQRQNYGLVAFAAASTGQRVPHRLTWVLLLPALAGCLAVMPALLDSAFSAVTFWHPFAGLIGGLSVVAYLAGALTLAHLVYHQPAIFRNPWIAVFTIGAFCFFLPPMLLPDKAYAFWSYALAHGFQYLLMVFILARGPRSVWLHFAVFSVATLGGGLLLHRLAGDNALFISGILLTWIHFVLDARLWKMSDAGPRKLIRKRFAFLFER
jgi:hypothetical protein